MIPKEKRMTGAVLVKYVAVTESGDWQIMGDTEQSIRERAALYEARGKVNLNIERWTYPVLADKSHGSPVKVRL